MTSSYVALGSNLGDPARQLRAAVAALDASRHCTVQRHSPVYRSTALGPGQQPDYLNAVVLLDTRLSALDLLDSLQQIETRQGRERTVRWGPRTIDLDILLYGDAVIESPRLRVPHPGMKERKFVLRPLADIFDDNLLLPDGTDLDTLVAACTGSSPIKTAERLR